MAGFVICVIVVCLFVVVLCRFDLVYTWCLDCGWHCVLGAGFRFGFCLVMRVGLLPLNLVGGICCVWWVDLFLGFDFYVL